MILETILGIATGIGGSVVTGIFNYKTQKLKNTHDLAMVDAETKAMIAETKADVEKTKAVVEGEIELADSKAYMLSQQTGQKDIFKEAYLIKLFEQQGWYRCVTVPIATLLIVLFGFIDIFRRSMRPGLTAYLVGVTSWITVKAWQVLEAAQGTLTAAQASILFTNVTNVVIYLTVSCVTWWFGDRRMAKFLMRLNDGNLK